MNELTEKQFNRQVIYNGKIIKVVKDEVVLPNNEHAFREVAYHNGGACAAVVDGDGIYFVKQFRYPFNDIVIELPAGKLEKGENPDLTIIRELAEEIGVVPKKIEKVGIMYSSPGFTNEIIHLYFVNEFEFTKTNPDEDEFLEIIKINKDKAYEMIKEGKIVDGKTICCLLQIKERIL